MFRTVCSHEAARVRVLRPRGALLAAALLLAGSCGGSGGGSDGTLIPPSTTPVMIVSPNTIFQTSGVLGGPFTPSTMDYLVRNSGTGTLVWSADSSETWGSVSLSGGTLDAGEEVTVTFSIVPSVAQSLPAGLHTASVDFVNEVNGLGSQSMGVILDIAPLVRELVLTPPTGLNARGPRGGPFTPESMAYSLRNDGNDPVDWVATVSEPGVTVTPTGGTLGSGASEPVTLTIDQAIAAQLQSGSYFIDVTFAEVGGTATPIVRTVTLDVIAPGGTTGQVISQLGITWTFSKDEQIGQYANGDWWVVGPVDVVAIDPASEAQAPEWIANGSMINPSPRSGLVQGYDSTMYAQYGGPGSYSPAMNVAFGVDAANPLRLQAGTSLVSTVSRAQPNVRPQTAWASILTVVDQPPAPGSFRPPYCGTDKTPRFNEGQLDYSLLEQLPRVPGTPSMERVSGWFLRPWVDHVPIWVGRYTHPFENMPDYGREIADQVGIAALMLHLDFTDAEKRDLLVRFVQLGIDLYGVLEDGGNESWLPNQGHMSGRKWPILFAGLVLGDQDMRSVGFDPTANFGEDGQTFYVAETSPGVYNFGFGGYTAADVGLPEWGGFHQTNPALDDKNWLGDPYRLCCTANAWWGQLLAAHIMGARGLWNHEPLFDYQDRFLTENRARGITDFRLAWSRFPLDMWDAYRSDY